MDPYTPDTDIPLTPELRGQLSLEKDLFAQEKQKCIREFDSADDNEYYVLSTKFVKEWEEMASAALSSPAPDSGPKTVHTPKLMNSELVQEILPDFHEAVLDREAQEHAQFMLVNRAVMQIFELYQGTRIPRLAYFSGANKMVQLHPIKFEFVFFSCSWFERIHQKDSQEHLPVLRSLAYKNETVLDLLYRLAEFAKKDPRNRKKEYANHTACRIYAGKNFSPLEYEEKIRQETSSENMLLPPGDEIKQSMQIGELEIPEGHQPIMIVELIESRWVYCSSDAAVAIGGGGKEDRCEYCRVKGVQPVACKCQEVEYCSESCREKDWRYHMKTCPVQMEEDNKDPEFVFTQKSRRGLVGLSNLGNTCYMNAALQCMQHTRGLTEYFVQKLYLEEINEANPIGSKGKLLKSYAKFVESVLTTENELIAPSKLKYTIGKTKEMFSGYEQHDSQQFLLFMLDTLHEDLNRVRDKPYTNSVDSNDRPDNIVAKQSWINYQKRNQSIVNDLMGGQYKSEVKCPDCNSISVTFDPFLIYSVPIPSNEAKSVNLYLFFANYNKETLKMTITSKNNIASELREDACQKAEAKLDFVKFFILGFNGAVREVQDDETVDRLINQKQFNENGEERQLFALEFLPEELVNIEYKKFLIFKFVAGPQVLTFKRPFPFEWNNIKGSNVYDRICEFLLSLWCKSEYSMQEKEQEAKLKVFRTKVQEQKLFQIYICHGEVKTVKERLIYFDRTLLTEDTDVTKILQECNFSAEFEVCFDKNPHFTFNSYKTHRDINEPYESYYSGHKTGTNENYTLEQCLDEMKKPETLLEGNEVWCSKCEDLKLAEKKMEMYKASKYLIIQLKRFKQIGYEKSKNHAEVNFPVDLDLAGHIIDSTLPETYFLDCEDQFIKPNFWKGFDTSQQTKYKLYGVVNHHGSLGGGHYTAYARHGDQWYLFDDSRVEEVATEKIVSSAAYLLFYERL